MKIIPKENSNAVDIACDFLRKGEVISFATDTVYGIACDASNAAAIDRLFEVKKRDLNKPIAILVKNLAMAEEIFIFDEKSRKIAQEFLPGKLTLVLEKNPNATIKIAPNLNSKDNSLGFRIIDDAFITKLMNKFNGILALTSANISGQNPALTSLDVKNSFSNSKLALVISSEIKNSSEVSTVVKIINGEVEVLRKGAINL